MVEMNPYYARESTVGPVFDVATYSPPKAVLTALGAACLAAVMGGLAISVWNPDWIMSKPPPWFADAKSEIKGLWRQHPQGTAIGVGIAGLVGLVSTAVAGSCLWNAISGNYYVRVGEGGLSLRVPHGLGTLQLDLPWDVIHTLTVIQEKQFGALSQSSGNLGASLRIDTRDGKRYDLRMDHFRQPGYLISNRIEEARQMRPARMEAGHERLPPVNNDGSAKGSSASPPR